MIVSDYSLSDVEGLVFESLEDVGVDKDSVVFVYVFGSFVEDREVARDIDVCISLDSGEVSDLGVVEQRVNGRLPEEVHLSVFENLPLQVKNQVFKGELLYKRDKEVYDKALETFRDYEFFEPLYKEIIGA